MASLDIFPLPCIYKQLLGIACPMCGFQRSVLLLSQGRIGDSIVQFPPIVSLAVMALYLTGAIFIKKLTFSNKWLWLFFAASFLFNLFYQNIACPDIQ